MWCVHGSKVCIMVQDTQKKTRYGLKWVYIPEKKWDAMTDQEKARYIC